MKESAERFTSAMQRSRTLRLMLVAFLVILLEIPVSMIGHLVSDREQRRQAAIAEVSAKWGNAQSITGPALVVPYTHRWTETAVTGKIIDRSETRNAIFLPEQLHVRGALKTDLLHRGIFTIPVYKLALVLEGNFAHPRFADLGIDPTSADWSRAHLAVGISDARAIQNATSITWNGQQHDFLPGTNGFAEGGEGIHAMIDGNDATARYDFSFPLNVNGSMSMDFVPFAQTTVVDIKGNYGNPSFQGNWLPSTRNVTESAFAAEWSVPFLGRNYPQAWTSEHDMSKAVDASRFGLALVDPVDHYHMTERSVKYAALFILLTFATLWLIEVMSGVLVHPIQYLMVGSALCLFYLLELSLSEHLGFPFAYALASVAVIAMVGAYSIVVLRRTSRAVVVGAGVTLLYSYLYLLLMNEDYALLIGSIGLFAILALIMWVTRRINWYSDTALPSGATPDLRTSVTSA